MFCCGQTCCYTDETNQSSTLLNGVQFITSVEPLPKMQINECGVRAFLEVWEFATAGENSVDATVVHSRSEDSGKLDFLNLFLSFL